MERRLQKLSQNSHPSNHPALLSSIDQAQLIASWLQRVVGLPEYAEKYAALFQQHGWDVESIVGGLLNLNEMERMGISMRGHRLRIQHHLPGLLHYKLLQEHAKRGFELKKVQRENTEMKKESESLRMTVDKLKLSVDMFQKETATALNEINRLKEVLSEERARGKLSRKVGEIERYDEEEDKEEEEEEIVSNQSRSSSNKRKIEECYKEQEEQNKRQKSQPDEEAGKEEHTRSSKKRNKRAQFKCQQTNCQISQDPMYIDVAHGVSKNQKPKLFCSICSSSTVNCKKRKSITLSDFRNWSEKGLYNNYTQNNPNN